MCREVQELHGRVGLNASREKPQYDFQKETSQGMSPKSAIDYLEMFTNSHRRHSTLGYLSPNAFEAQAKVALEEYEEEQGRMLEYESRRDHCMRDNLEDSFPRHQRTIGPTGPKDRKTVTESQADLISYSFSLNHDSQRKKPVPPSIT